MSKNKKISKKNKNLLKKIKKGTKRLTFVFLEVNMFIELFFYRIKNKFSGKIYSNLGIK